MKDCAGKGASMATKLKKIIPKEIAPAKPMDWKGFNPLASTVEVSEQLSLADEERTKAVIRAIKSGEIDGPAPEFNPDNFKLGEFLERPLGVLGIPYGKLTSDFLALMLNLETLYKELNQDNKYESFDVEIQKFEDEIPLQKNKKTHPFWTCGGNFGAIAYCYLDCVFGLKYSRLDSDHNQALNHYASASRITGWLEAQAGFDYKIGVNKNLENAREKRHEPTRKMRDEANRLYSDGLAKNKFCSKNSAKFNLKPDLINFAERHDVGFMFTGDNIEDTIYNWLCYPDGKKRKVKK